MAISDSDSKLLWGRAAGICSNPSCRADLTSLLIKQGNYNVGEMAHIIARSAKGPRGKEGGGSNTYDNLILLCPTCHRHIDKSPDGIFTAEQLHEWKANHESKIRRQLNDIVFNDIEELKKAVSMLLIENHSVWLEFGPQSEIAQKDPGSNAFQIWNLRKMGTIIPNNQKIINMVERNIDLLSTDDYKAFLLFKNHTTSFEANQYGRLDYYPTFPEIFREAFEV